jgi:hypothetical protein
MIEHPAARTITQEQRATIYHYLDENIPPRQIIGLIRKSDPTILITPMDVYDLRKSFLREQLAGRTSIQYLQDQLLTHQWKFAFKQDKESVVRSGHPAVLGTPKHHSKCDILQLDFSTLKA